MAEPQEPAPEPDPVRMVELLNAFLAAELEEKRRLLETEGYILLHPATEAVLREAARNETEDEQQAAALTWHADLLAVCRPQILEQTAGSTGEASTPADLADMLRELPDLAEQDGLEHDRERLQELIALCKQILARLSRVHYRGLWGIVHSMLGDALRRLGDLTGDAAALHQAEQAIREALLERTRERAPMDWAVTQNILGSVLLSLGDLTGDTGMLRQAEQAFRDALLEFTRERAPMDWAGTHTNLGSVLGNLGDLTGDAGMLRQAEQAFRDALLEFTRECAAMQWAATQNSLGRVLLSLGDLTGDAAVLRDAEQACRNALLERTRERVAMLWAMTQNNLGNVLLSLAGVTGSVAMLRAAEEAYRNALLERTRERAPMEWAGTQSNLGTVLQSLGDLTGDAGMLRQAERAFRAALLELPRERAPMSWAATQTNLGSVLRSLGNLTGDASVLRQAEQAYRAALLERTRAHAPMGWAMTQNNLGVILQSLGALTGDAGMLRQAEQACRAALLEFTRERTAMQWAATQSSLGSVLRSLGDLTGDASVLRQAEQAYRAALLERTRAHAPMGWAMTQNNLGAVLQSLGALTGDAGVLRQSEEAYRAALLERTRDRAPMDWAMTQTNLGNVLRSLGDLTGDAEVLRQAEQAYRAALLERTRERAPMDWAATQTNLGSVLLFLGDLTGDAVVLRAAEAAYRAALLEQTRARAPMDWAGTQNNLGNVLQSLGDLTGDAVVLRTAEEAYRAALSVMEESSAEDTGQGTAGSLARLLVRLDDFDAAGAVIAPALARSDLAMMDAARSRDGIARAVGRVGDLYALLSLCCLKQATPDPGAALVAAASGRARLLADALALDAARLEDINDPDIRTSIEAARDSRGTLRVQLGYDRIVGEVPRSDLAREERERLQAELRQANDTYVALCRQHGLIRRSEPLDITGIAAAVPAGGALVLPVLTETAAFAFVVVESSDEPAVIDLPRLDRRAVIAHLSGKDGWLGVYYENFRDHREDGDGGAAKAAAALRWHGYLTATLAWLWERLLGPVHQHLRDTAKLRLGAPVVLLPPGLLGLLPLHAAGPGPDGHYFCDHWTVSHAPSVQALLACQQRVQDHRDVPARLLAVIDPLGDLPGAAQEVPMLRQCFAHAEQVILQGGEAILPAVLTNLPRATCFHASTHGRHDPMQPSESLLLLADEHLRLVLLRDTRLEAVRLVFLSACESGLAGVRQLPEEFIGLPAGFVQAGAACVVGSLWPIRDDAAFLLASRFYQCHLHADGRERLPPTIALRDAQEWLRRLTFGELRQMFPVQDEPAGKVLLLQAAMRMVQPDVDPYADNSGGRSNAGSIRLPLGPDKECPYTAADHWAAFIATGA